jgi:hypothetical protein
MVMTSPTRQRLLFVCLFDCMFLFVCLFGGVSKAGAEAGDSTKLPKTSLPVAVLRVAKRTYP